LSPSELLAALIAARPTLALFTDFDGTLSPIVADPGAARPAPGAVEALADLVPRCRRVAVLSGRPLAYLDPLVPAVVDVGALYGLEQRVGGRHAERADAAPWRAVVAEAAAAAGARFAATPGVVVEPKGLSLTVHFRAAPQAAADVAAWADAAARATGLHPRTAKASVELHPPLPTDKGALLTAWSAGASTVAYFGDDLGDLPAFDALADLAAGGTATLAIAVGGPETPTEVLARADVTLDGPAAVARVLQALAAAS
jgi:trehalose 6-phosphate phosphatase